MGISAAIPYLLQNRGISYAEQAGFTFIYYPFTSKTCSVVISCFEIIIDLFLFVYWSIVKILWAPIVDSVYIKAFGRRKSWLIPTQILIGIFMLYLAQNVDDWLGDGTTRRPQMFLLTSVFFMLWLLTATQDIAVDGWALTSKFSNKFSTILCIVTTSFLKC